jgi:hypothetical protein
MDVAILAFTKAKACGITGLVFFGDLELGDGPRHGPRVIDGRTPTFTSAESCIGRR